MKTQNGIPEGFHTLTPHITVRGGAAAIEFYKKAFGAVEIGRSLGPDGKSIMHAELQIGDSKLMLNEEVPDWGCLSPLSKPGAGLVIHMYVENVDAVFDRAIKAGATQTMPVGDQFWGDRYGQLQDPFGHRWSIATRNEQLSRKEIDKRAEKFFSGAGCGAK